MGGSPISGGAPSRGGALPHRCWGGGELGGAVVTSLGPSPIDTTLRRLCEPAPHLWLCAPHLWVCAPHLWVCAPPRFAT